MRGALTIVCILWVCAVSAQDTTWCNRPPQDLIYHQSLLLQNARWDFYVNLFYWVERNGSKELRAKAKMTEKNFMKKLTSESFTPAEIKAIMQGFITVYPLNMYGHDLSEEPEHELGKLQ